MRSHTSTRLPAVARSRRTKPADAAATTMASQSSLVAAPLVALVAVMRRVVGAPLAAFMRRVVVGACSAAAHCRLQRTTAVRIAAIGCCASQAAYQRTVRDTSLYLLEQ